MTSQALELSRNKTVPHEVRYLAAEVLGLAHSRLVPDALRGKPDDLLLVALTGRELGLPGLTVSLQNVYAINGTPCLSAKLCVAKALNSGLVEIWTEEFSDTQVTVAGCRTKTPGRITRVTWTTAMAKRAGLEKNPNWSKYPQNMLYARASKELVKQLCPEVMLGLDDGRHFDELAGAPVEHEPDEADMIVDTARRNAAAAASSDDDEVTDAELVDPAPLGVEDWPASWTRRMKAAGMSRADSIRIIHDVSRGAASDSGTLHPDLRPAADAALAEVLAQLDGAA